jgi:hypothetical protein
MSDPEGFLTRWARRKQDTAKGDSGPADAGQEGGRRG